MVKISDEYLKIIHSFFNETSFVESQLHGGMMNEAFIINENNKKHVVYFPVGESNSMVDRAQEMLAQALCEEAKITRKCSHFNPTSGVKSFEFIEGLSIDHINETEIDYEKVTSLLIKLHSLSTEGFKQYDAHKRFNEYINDLVKFDKNAIKPIYENMVLIDKYLLEFPKKYIATCHNDSQRSNIIKDSNGNYFLIDFEFIGLNDPVYDIAAFGNTEVKEGYKLLEYYNKQKPLGDDYKVRYAVWRIYISMQWYVVAMLKHYRGEGEKTHFDFTKVADFFLNNMNEARKLLDSLEK